MTTLVTGAGMIGAMAALQLLDRGERPILYDVVPPHDFLSTVIDYGKVKVISGDILDLPHLITTIREEKVDRIIHTAGLLTAVAMVRPFSAIRANILGTATVLEAARLTGVKRVVFTSTAAVYHAIPDPPSGTYPEDYASRNISDRQKGIYPITKLTAEQVGLVYSDQYSVEFAALRFAGVFGMWKGTPSGVPGMLMDNLVKGSVMGKEVVLGDEMLAFSGGFDFLYSKDAAKSTVLACFAPKLEQKIYNISTGKYYTLDETIEIVKKVIPNANITSRGREEERGLSGYAATHSPIDLSAARKELGYQPDYDLEKGVREYADWLKKYL